METETPILIHTEALPFFNISLYLNKINAIQSLSIENRSEESMKDIVVTLTSDIPCFKPFSYNIEAIKAADRQEIPLTNLRVNREWLGKLSETETAVIEIALLKEEEVLVTQDVKLEVHPTEYFPGFEILPQLIAGFITPNHPYIYQLQRNAADILEKQGVQIGFDSYQSGSQERVLQMMSAVYTAIQNQNIIYSSLPPGYEKIGQRIRLLNTIQKEHIGNCIDISLLFAACLEAIDLHPILIIVKGHAFVGCWLKDDKFPEVVNFDKTALTKRISRGIKEIAVVEATSICRGSDIPFSKAIDLGAAQLVEKEDFILFVDIKTARSATIRPLPLLTEEKEGETIDWDDVETRETTHQLETDFNIGEIYQDELLNQDKGNVTKLKIWERKLLDLSLRNNLLNLRPTKNMIQLMDVDISALEDKLWEGAAFSISHHPTANQVGRYSQFIQPFHHESPEFKQANEELKYNRLLSFYHKNDLDTTLNHIHKKAKEAIEENGSSTLYLALGLLKWIDPKKADISRYAPILLLPVEIGRRSVNSKFTLKGREEETMINITLLEFLRQEFQLNLGGLEDLPRDEKGVDVPKVMALIRRAIMQLPGWDVQEQLFLGNFSFSKLILWNDLVLHQDDLVNNDLVRSLIEGRVVFQNNFDSSKYDLEHINSVELSLPIATDVSQMEAVLAAQKGQSFILHGPPGTGKSQTITNIIADALAHDKRVLFVAAKKAALDVVYRRLEQIGIDPFCLELHSNKSKKSDILRQLEQTLDSVENISVADFSHISEQLDDAKQELSKYVEQLHKKRKIGWNLYHGIVAHESYEDQNLTAISVPNEIVEQTKAEQWEQWEQWIKEFKTIISLIQHPKDNPLNIFASKQNKIVLADDIDQIIRQVLPNAKQLKSEKQQLQELLKLPNLNYTFDSYQWLFELNKSIKELPDVPISFFNTLYTKERKLVFNDWLQLSKSHQPLKREFLKENNETLLKKDFNEFEIEWNKAIQSWFLAKWFKKRKIKKELSAYRKTPIQSDSAVENLLKKGKEIQALQEELSDGKYQPVIKDLKYLYQDKDTDFDTIEQNVSKTLSFLQLFSQNTSNLKVSDWLEQLNEKSIERVEEIKKSVSDSNYGNLWQENRRSLSELNQQTGYENPKDETWIDEMVQQLTRAQAHLSHWKNWTNYFKISETGRAQNLGWIIDAFENKQVVSDKIVPTFYYSFYKAWMTRPIATDESLSFFNAPLFEEKIELYKQKAVQYRELTIQELKVKLSSGLPRKEQEALQSSEPGILYRAIRSKGRGKSIRTLFDQLPNLLPKIAPCMLMSPISVAQYFDASQQHFDLIIFDEASQLPTSEAVSSLARAKQAIIVGDPNQMPPTAFFTSNKVDEDNLEIEDLESILDDCLALPMPSRYLLRHYRSKHESLISFSNNNYYDGKLLTFPSADNLSQKVIHHPVAGYYDKGKTRTNSFEADAIVDFVLRHFEDNKRKIRSLGIVTFSQTQQSLIEDKLDSLYAKNPDLEVWATQGEEPLFVKNLENVQGDERDFILFSIGYGKDINGKLSMNFGPLNREGGWRRLNVAVTRSRYEMHVFSTLRSEEIDLSRTGARGVAGLKGFLSFAEKGASVLSNEHEVTQSKNVQLSQMIAKELKNRGWKSAYNIGSSDFKIDLGIINPKNPDEFIMALLIDGDNYYQARTSNDRELVMPQVLKSLGWNIHRVWSLEWLENKEKVIEEIIKHLERLPTDGSKENPSPTLPKEPMPAVKSVQDQLVENVNSAKPKVQIPYTSYQPENGLDIYNLEDVYDIKNREKLQELIKIIVKTEGPISKDFLFKKIAQLLNINRIGSRLNRYFEELVDNSNFHELHHNQIFYLASTDSLPILNYRENNTIQRSMDNIAPEEILCAVLECVRENYSIDKDELIRHLAKVFSFNRIGSTIESQINLSFELGISAKQIKEENGRILVVKP